MNEWGYGFIILLPVVIPAILLIGFQGSSKKVMPVTLLIIVLLAMFAWSVTPERVTNSVIQGLTTTICLLWMIFGAIFLLNVLKQTGAIHIIRQSFTEVSSDRRIQVIIIAWCFGIFIESISSFGISAIIVAPLLIVLGFPSLAAVIMAMLVQISSSSLSVMSSSIIIDVQSSLHSNTLGTIFINEKSYWNHLLELITNEIIITHTIIGTFIPFFMVLMLTRFFGTNKSWKEGFSALPFALFAGLTFTIPYAITEILFGSKFSSLGGLFSIFIVLFTTKRGFFLPKTIWDFPCETLWEKKWLGSLVVEKKYVLTGRISPLSAWSPYILILLMLFCYHTLIELKLFSIDVNFFWTNIFREKKLSSNIISLSLSGGLLLITALFSVISQSKSTECFKMIRDAGKDSFKLILGASFLLMFILPIISIYINSNINISSIPMVGTNLTTNPLSSVASSTNSFISPLTSNSNVIPTILFNQFYFETENIIFIPSSMTTVIQTLQAVTQNMMTIQNIFAVSATVGLFGQEAAILRKTIIPTICYIVITGIIAMFALYGLNINNPFLG